MQGYPLRLCMDGIWELRHAHMWAALCSCPHTQGHHTQGHHTQGHHPSPLSQRPSAPPLCDQRITSTRTRTTSPTTSWPAHLCVCTCACRLVDQAEGKVPVIKDGDMLLPDSDKIVEYLEAKFPEPAFKSAVPAEM